MKQGSDDPYILSTPKPLLKIREMPIIERIVRKLYLSGIKIGIVINPTDEMQFKDALKEYDITYCHQLEPKGTANALYSARNFVSDDLFLVYMGDDISDYNFNDLIEADKPTIFGAEVEHLDDYGAIIIDSNGYAEKILEKAKTGTGIANSGIYVMPKEFFEIYDMIQPNQLKDEYYLTEAVNLLYNAGNPFILKKIEYWKGINRLTDLIEENKFNKDALNIRNAKQEDLNDLMSLLSQLSKNLEGNNYYFSLGKQLDAILSDKNMHLLIAEYHGEIVGTATLLVQPNLTHSGRPYGHIENVVTRNDMRGNGIGMILVENLINLGKKRDCYKIILDCKTDNIRFYEKSGFQTTGQVEMRMDF